MVLPATERACALRGHSQHPTRIEPPCSRMIKTQESASSFRSFDSSSGEDIHIAHRVIAGPRCPDSRVFCAARRPPSGTQAGTQTDNEAPCSQTCSC
jgi:hypothetical protein